MSRLAIIGAGVSGLAAAFELSTTEAEVVVFEKSKGLSGRAASRTREGCRYDHGANYFKVDGNGVARLLFEDLPTDDLCRIVGDIHVFDGGGVVSPGDPAQNATAKWSYRGGISAVGKLLVETAEIDVRHERRIVAVAGGEKEWLLRDEFGGETGPFDAVLLTPPAPQAAALLGDESAPELAEALGAVEYHSQFSVLLNLPGTIALPGEAYALINCDRTHEIAWISLENRKAGHVPSGQTLLIVQMSPDWSAAHFDDPQGNIIERAWSAADALVGGLPRPRWADAQRWKFAHPKNRLDESVARSAEPEGLFVAGDALVGKGRVSKSIRTGIEAAERMKAELGLG